MRNQFVLRLVRPDAEVRPEVRRATNAASEIHPNRLRVRRSTGAAIAQGLGVVGQAGLKGVAADLLHRLAHEVGKGRQRHQLPRGEEVAVGREAVLHGPEVARVVGQRLLWLPSRLCLPRRSLVLGPRRQIHAPALALGHDRHQPRAHPPGLALGLDVVARYRRPRHQALEVRAARELRPVLRPLRILRLAHLHREPVAAALDHRLDVRLLAALGREHEGRGERYVHVGEGRVRALNCPRPQPRDHGELLAHIRFEVGPSLGHLGRDLNRRVERADALLGLVAHPLAVVTHVLGQTLRALPLAGDERLLLSRLGIHRRPACKAGRDLDHRLVDQHRDRVQVARVRFQSEPLRLERQRAATGEGVVEGGELVPVEELLRARVVGVLRAGAAPALPDLVARGLQHRLVGGVLPLHEILDDAKEPLALLLLLLLGGKEVGQRRRVVHHLREDHRPRRRQRPPRPPQVQRARVAVADRLLARAGLVDRLERQGDFDQLLLHRHGRGTPTRWASARASRWKSS